MCHKADLRHWWKLHLDTWWRHAGQTVATGPKRVNFRITLSNIEASSCSESNIESRFDWYNDTWSNVQYSSTEQQPPSLNPGSAEISRLHFNAMKMLLMCEDFEISLTKAYFGEMKNDSFFSNILLVIVFNHPYYSHVQHPDAIHLLIFPYVVYCWENQTKSHQETGDLGTTLTFIEADVDKGKVGYLCTVKDMEMGYKV